MAWVKMALGTANVAGTGREGERYKMRFEEEGGIWW